MGVEIGGLGLGNCLQHPPSFGLLASHIKSHGFFHTGQTQDGTQNQERKQSDQTSLLRLRTRAWDPVHFDPDSTVESANGDTTLFQPQQGSRISVMQKKSVPPERGGTD